MVGYDWITDIGVPALGASSVVRSAGVDQERETRKDRRCCGGMSRLLLNQCLRQCLTRGTAFDTPTVDPPAIIAPDAVAVGRICHYFSPVPHHDYQAGDDWILASPVSPNSLTRYDSDADHAVATILGSSTSGLMLAG